ncbi:sulfatase-like hydrolase/transferase [Candidatus Binatia bacterium]|nr:sulfatase-like hydrolase/transferase [Candidatus Binatia bacterium]
MRTAPRCFGAAVAALLLTACTSHAEPRPNVVLIIADDLNVRDIPLAMPRVEKLAEQAARFDATFTPLPLCGPSRISLLTGKLPRTHGFRSNDPTGFDGSDTVATRLHAAGYSTTILGKLLNKHHRATNLEAGWDTYLPFERHDDYGTAQSDILAKQTLEKMRDSRAPFFVYVGAAAPHGPLGGPERCLSRPIPDRPPTVREARWTQRMTALCGLDDLVASLVEARGPDTYVLFTADNGWMYGENMRTGKSELVIDAAQIPLIVWGPDVVPAHRREIVSLVDVTATVLSVAQASREGVEGRSVLPLLRDQDAERWTGTLVVEGQ